MPSRADNKTVQNRSSVKKFLASVEHDKRREDCSAVVDIMADITGETPKMWGDSIVGFGYYEYRYESGREGEMFFTGVSPRKQSLTIYIVGGFDDHQALLEKLGKFKTSKVCLYVNKLEDVHLPTLKRLIRASVKATKKREGVK